jgi:SNF2 family DNA or RNA helicase
VQVADDFELPHLEYWNYSPCKKHIAEGADKPVPGCRHCGMYHRKHQRIGATWLYLKKRALLADVVGSGKTAHAATVIAMMKETGEIDKLGRVLVVCRSPAVLQWHAELERMLPRMHIEVSSGPNQAARIQRYVQHWEVMVIGQHMYLKDYELFDNFDLSAVFVDDVDALRAKKNKTAYALKRVALKTPRFVVMTGTPLQKKLHELHSVFEPLGGREIFGSEYSFLKRYVRSEVVEYYVKTPTGSKKRSSTKVVGYKNLTEFKQLIGPMALRRTADDIDDVDLPEIIPNNVWLDLYPAQRAKYELLRKGVVSILKDGKSQVKQAQAIAKIHYGQKICAGLAALGEEDGPDTSVKMDWVMDKINSDGDLGDEKVVIFAGYKDTIKALQKRLQVADIGYETIWGSAGFSLVLRQLSSL